MMPTGPLSWIGVAAVAALVMATLIGQRLGRMRWARVFAIVAIGATAYSTNQIHSRRTEARPPASSVPPAPHGGLGGLSRHPANSGPDFRSSSF